ncbi:MAG: DUF1552 domain-containing protein [Acidobacteria bacterium]|nr:DUF1552 domain-containing protein [Acidobacteriota bacterium]
MFITKTHLPRRTVLRGVGTALALPFLDAMVPALTALGRTAAAPVRRAAWFYVPNGMSMRHWLPEKEGALPGELPMILESLTPYRDDLVVLSNLAHMTAYPREGDPACDHARSGATYLTGVHADPDLVSPVTDVSVDQRAAIETGRETQLASLELGVAVRASCVTGSIGYPCAYRTTISYRTPTMALPVEIDPRAVFERLFGVADSTDRKSRLARISRNASLLDSVTNEIAHLNGKLASTDRSKLSGYLESVREVERRIQMAEAQSDRELPAVDKPAGIPETFAGHAQLMGDLLVLAYQTDLSRVATFMLAEEVSSRAYPEAGVPDSHHALSHHQNVLANIDRLAKLNEFHMQQFAHVVGKLKSIPEADGTLLDRTMLVYGTGISDSNAHLHDDLPIALVGGRAAGIKGGRHIRYPKETPLTNLWLTVLDKMGVHVDKLGDSTGSIKLATV